LSPLSGRRIAHAGALLLAASFVFAGCSSAAASPSAGTAAPATSKLVSPSPAESVAPFEVSSPAFASFLMDIKYTQDGDGISPPVEWKNAPAGTAVLVLVETDQANYDYTHWIVLNIPGAPSGSLPEDYKGTQLYPYISPGPQPGHTSTYCITLYALKEPIDLKQFNGLGQALIASTLTQAMEGKVLAETSMTAQYTGAVTID
jgi:phosphatidylethanolamine-binding protein (PEBP) family uncharacterized protein